MKHAKSIDRLARRQFERENAKIFKEFSTVRCNFEDALFGYDWDSSENLQNFPVFEKFNNIWIDFCQQWNKDRNHVALALPLSFYEYAIDQNLNPGVVKTFCSCEKRQDQHKNGEIWFCGDCDNEIKQILKTDTTTTTDRLDNDQKTVSNEKETTGDIEGRPEGQTVQGQEEHSVH